jgi:hypothetical protein
MVDFAACWFRSTSLDAILGNAMTPAANSRISRARMTSWIQVLLELQRERTRHDTFDGSRAIVETYGGGYGIGLAYARDMIRPG